MKASKLNQMGVVLGFVAVLFLAGCANNATTLDKRSPLAAQAKQGDAEAQYQLGRTYCCGWGAGYDRAIAREWFCKAAMQGHGGAQYQLGRMLGERMDSHSVPKKRENLIESYMWYSLAALQNVVFAAEERDALKIDLSSQELFESEERIRKWRKLDCR